MKNVIVAVMCLVACGCMSTKTNIDIQTTRQWEGHFFSKEQIQEKIQTMDLKDGESVWIMSNGTLFKMLENYRVKIESEK